MQYFRRSPGFRPRAFTNAESLCPNELPSCRKYNQGIRVLHMFDRIALLPGEVRPSRDEGGPLHCLQYT